MPSAPSSRSSIRVSSAHRHEGVRLPLRPAVICIVLGWVLLTWLYAHRHEDFTKDTVASSLASSSRPLTTRADSSDAARLPNQDVFGFLGHAVSAVAPILGGTVDPPVTNATNLGRDEHDPEPYTRFDPSKWQRRPDIVHVVFSTDCSPFQDWQSQVLFYSAEMVGHVGPITRIASGCDTQSKTRLRALFEEKRAKRSWSDAWIHFTPHFSTDQQTGRDYKFYNKPFGISHWLQHGDHGGVLNTTSIFAPPTSHSLSPPFRQPAPAPSSPGSSSPSSSSSWSSLASWARLPSPAVIALIDPDNFFLRPLTAALGTASNLLVSNPVKATDLLASWPKVAPGKPAGQFYGLGDKWLQFDRAKICGSGGSGSGGSSHGSGGRSSTGGSAGDKGSSESPCTRVTSGEAWRYFSVGPPYILHFADWIKLGRTWAQFVPRVYAQYPQLLAEMYAYCLAAAHLELRHARVDSHMVSNVGSYGEGWAFIDAMPSVCRDKEELFPPLDRGTRAAHNQPERAGGSSSEVEEEVEDDEESRRRRNTASPLAFTDPANLPTFLHVCQTYSVGKGAKFGKRNVAHDLFSCEATAERDEKKKQQQGQQGQQQQQQRRPSRTAIATTPLPRVKEDVVPLAAQIEVARAAAEAELTKRKLTPQEKQTRALKRNAFMVCTATKLINEAVRRHRSVHCQHGSGNQGGEPT